MKKRTCTDILPATPEELRLINRLTRRPVLSRLEAGELAIVQNDDWSDVPELEERPTIRVPKSIYRKMASLSRKRHTTPERLASRWLSERLSSL